MKSFKNGQINTFTKNPISKQKVYMTLLLVTVIVDTKPLKACIMTGNRVNYVGHGDRPVP